MLGGVSRYPHGQEVLMSSFAAAVERIKGDVAGALPAALIRQATNALAIHYREPGKDPEKGSG